MAVNRVARVVVLLALLWSLGSLLAAVNWHSIWLGQQRIDSGSDVALHAQERWQHWVDMTLLGVVAAVLALAGALWPLVRAAGERAARRAAAADGSTASPAASPAASTDIDLRGGTGFGGGSAEGRRHAEQRDAV